MLETWWKRYWNFITVCRGDFQRSSSSVWICLCKNEPNDSTVPLKSFHSWMVWAVLYFHSSHSTFSFPVFLKINITEFQRLLLGKYSLSSHTSISSSFLKHLLAATNKSRWAIGMTRTYLCVYGTSFKSVMRTSLLCKMSDTMILMHSLHNSRFYLHFRKNKPVGAESVSFRGVCPTK